MDNITYLQKYQPDSLHNMVGQNTIRDILIKMVETQNIPHLLFTGIPGSGKSTAAKALMKDLYGSDYKSNHVTFDASSTDRGISTVRGRIKDLTKYKSLNYPFKCIIMEEADELTSASMFALREVMLQNQEITRFVYVCNDLSKIIHPIQDRCQILRFNQLSLDEISQHLKLIVKNEEISITPAQISTIAGLSRGSMRIAVNTLQTVSTQEHVTDNLIRTLMGAKFTDIDAKRILKAVFEKNQPEYEEIIFSLIYKSGFTADEIMCGLLDTLISKNDPKNIKIILNLSEGHYRMSQGVNPLIQLRCSLAKVSMMKR